MFSTHNFDEHSYVERELRTAESYFLPLDDDVVIAGVDAQLPKETYDALYRKIHAVLERLYIEGKILVSEGFVGYGGWDANSIEGLTSQMVIDIVKALRAEGIEPWQVAARSYDTDEAVAVYSTKNLPETWRYRGKPIDSNSAILPDDAEAVEALLDWQYSEAYAGQFPHVSLHHLNILAIANRHLLFSPVYVGLELVPVPGIQFMKYNMGTANKSSSAHTVVGWEAHWGEQYAEAYKKLLRETVRQYDAGIVVDLGCGQQPVSAGMHDAELIVLVDTSKEVAKLSGGNRVGVCLDIAKLQPESLDAVVGKQIVGRVDSILISDVLNYLPYKQILRSVAAYLKPGGRLILSNMPEQGFSKQFSPERPKDTAELIATLLELGFQIETVQDPLQLAGEKDSEMPISRYGMTFVVARKKMRV